MYAPTAKQQLSVTVHLYQYEFLHAAMLLRSSITNVDLLSDILVGEKNPDRSTKVERPGPGLSVEGSLTLHHS